MADHKQDENIDSKQEAQKSPPNKKKTLTLRNRADTVKRFFFREKTADIKEESKDAGPESPGRERSIASMPGSPIVGEENADGKLSKHLPHFRFIESPSDAN